MEIANGWFPGHRLTFLAKLSADSLTIAGLEFGIANTMVTPPAKAAAVPDEKSSL